MATNTTLEQSSKTNQNNSVQLKSNLSIFTIIVFGVEQIDSNE